MVEGRRKGEAPIIAGITPFSHRTERIEPLGVDNHNRGDTGSVRSNRGHKTLVPEGTWDIRAGVQPELRHIDIAFRSFSLFTGRIKI